MSSTQSAAQAAVRMPLHKARILPKSRLRAHWGLPLINPLDLFNHPVSQSSQR
ncbi:hypothetical protein [Ideonella paludis]|uniref:hypothetical protein n=1 Tax=Ideonella paludis TaxID=1233411 RepID=UPI00362D84FB